MVHVITIRRCVVQHGAMRHRASLLGPPMPVYRYTEYRDTAVNIGGIDTGIVLSNTVFSVSQILEVRSV